MPTKKKWSDVEVSALRDLAAACLSIEEVAIRLDRSSASVRYIAKKEGVRFSGARALAPIAWLAKGGCVFKRDYLDRVYVWKEPSLSASVDLCGPYLDLLLNEGQLEVADAKSLPPIFRLKET